MKSKFLLALTLLITFGCGTQNRSKDPLASQRSVGYSQVYDQVFSLSCMRCHNPETPKGKLDLTSYASVKERIVDGSPEQSKLWQRLGIKKDMPPPKAPEKVTEEQIELVRVWILEGAGE